MERKVLSAMHGRMCRRTIKLAVLTMILLQPFFISFTNTNIVFGSTQTLTPVADATIDLILPDTNFGHEHTLEVYSTFGARQVRRALIRFNLAAVLPPEAVIDSAELNLYLEGGEGGRVHLVAACLIEDWVEGNVTWNNRPATGAPFVVTELEVSIGYKSFDVTDIVRAWHNVPHYGLELRGPEEEKTYSLFFESREHGEMPPQLDVTYHLPKPDLVVTDVWRERERPNLLPD